jgi:hypothetical protein
VVGRKRDVDSRHNRDNEILGGTNRSFRRERAMVLGRDVLVGDVMLEEEGSEVGRGFVIEREVRERVGEKVEKGDDVTVGGDVRDRRSVLWGQGGYTRGAGQRVSTCVLPRISLETGQ